MAKGIDCTLTFLLDKKNPIHNTTVWPRRNALPKHKAPGL